VQVRPSKGVGAGVAQEACGVWHGVGRQVCGRKVKVRQRGVCRVAGVEAVWWEGTK